MDAKHIQDFPDTQVGDVGNYYGGLWIRAVDGQGFWCIENWDGMNWAECPPAVFKALRALAIKEARK